MKNSFLRSVAAAVVIALPFSALAADKVPDIKGKWSGKTFTIVAGQGGHWPDSNGTFDKPAFFEADVTLEFTGQEGRRFWGVTTITKENGAASSEPFIGELTGKLNRTAVIADTDGFFNGQFDGGTFSFCYTQVQGKTPASVVGCSVVKKAP